MLFKRTFDISTCNHDFSSDRLTSEYISCEDQLMRSACGSHLADFTLALSIKSNSPVLRSEENKCAIPPDTTQSGKF